ncbi:S-adenosyl-L-methionine-dependent methyltransferase [Phyllosticta capitalensis]|uniref:S-adenosyl-L-methionine-dependent methyltransferase n=1 Tax=Phyllosticta capitalensis TaxID=121624 RepID=UPI00312D766B
MTTHSSSSGSLEADTVRTDQDSALGDSAASPTTSLTPSILDYRYEHGRRYHAYKDGSYHLPNDEVEADRLDLQHHLFRLTTDDLLYLAPLPTNIHNVLDIGCGTGIWSIEFADEHPNANVLGIDLSPIQPTEIPPNCSFLVDDAEDEWTWDTRFDFIHLRAMVAAIKNWARLLDQSYEFLKPGGWIELQDLSVPPRCDDGSAPSDSAMLEISSLFARAAGMVGLDMQAPSKFPQMLRDIGFEDIHTRRYKWPIGPWAKGSKEKLLGRWALQDCFDGMQGGTMAFFTRVLKMKPEEVEARLAEARKEMKGQKTHLYLPVFFTYARKPLTGSQTAQAGPVPEDSGDHAHSPDLTSSESEMSEDHALKPGMQKRSESSPEQGHDQRQHEENLEAATERLES